MKRRDFFASLLAGAAGALKGAAASAPHTRRRTIHRAPPVPTQLNRVGVSTLSFHGYLETTHNESSRTPAGRLTLLDFPGMIADRFKIHNLEFATPHFPSLEPAYLQELKSSLVRSHSKLVSIPVDVRELKQGGGLSDPDLGVRGAAMAAVRSWIDIARQLGAHAVRCDPGCSDPDDLTATVDSYRKLASYGRAKGVTVLMENRCDVACADSEALVRILRAVASPFVGALPDFGEFPDEVTRLRGLPVLFSYARTVCHAKGLKLDSSGNETAFDFGRCMAISKQAGYKGIYSAVYEGDGDAYAGVQGVVNELLRYL
jgi:Xylose isomerase-like TIM barrel